MNNKIVKRAPTQEQLEYEDLTKRMRLVSTKMRISQEGVDVSSLSQQKLDMIIRIFDDMEHIQRDTQQKTSLIQQNANIEIQKANQDAGKKFTDIQKKYQEIIKSIKEANPEQIEEISVLPVKEEIIEKTHNEKVSEITDIVLKYMRDSVSSKVDEILKSVNSNAENVIGETKGEIIGEIKEEITT